MIVCFTAEGHMRAPITSTRAYTYKHKQEIRQHLESVHISLKTKVCKWERCGYCVLHVYPGSDGVEKCGPAGKMLLEAFLSVM